MNLKLRKVFFLNIQTRIKYVSTNIKLAKKKELIEKLKTIKQYKTHEIVNENIIEETQLNKKYFNKDQFESLRSYYKFKQYRRISEDKANELFIHREDYGPEVYRRKIRAKKIFVKNICYYMIGSYFVFNTASLLYTKYYLKVNLNLFRLIFFSLSMALGSCYIIHNRITLKFNKLIADLLVRQFELKK